MSSLQPLKSGSLTTRVADILRHAIFSGQFEPGRQLLEAHLARELQVSQTTIREALVQLDQIGLVDRIPNKGTFVTRLSEDDVRDRLTVRWLLEGLAWGEAAKRMTEDDFTELENRLESIRAAMESKDYVQAAETELNFHRFIWELSGNPTLAHTLEKISPPLFVFMTLQRNELGQSIELAYQRHKAVVDALRAGDSATLRATLDEHFLHSYEERFQKPVAEIAAVVEPESAARP